MCGGLALYAQHVGAGAETMQSVGEGVLYFGGVAGGGVNSSDFITEVKGQPDLTDFLDSCAMPTVNPAVSHPAPWPRPYLLPPPSTFALRARLAGTGLRAWYWSNCYGCARPMYVILAAPRTLPP